MKINGYTFSKRPVLPGGALRHDLFADLTDQLRRDLCMVEFLDLLEISR